MIWTLDTDDVNACPVKTRHVFSPGTERPPWPATPVSAYEIAARSTAKRLLDDLCDTHAAQGRVADLRPLANHPPEVGKDATIQEMRRGTDLILHAVLPEDFDSHRRGTADVLVRAEDNSGGAPGYVPVRVHGRRVLDSRPQGSVCFSSFLSPSPNAKRVLPGWDFKTSRVEDRLELAHLWCLLSACGHSCDRPPIGGLIGTDRKPSIAWAPLTASDVAPSPRTSNGSGYTTVMRRYEEEFRIRIEAVTASRAGTPNQVTPIHTDECDHCPWRTVCRELMLEDDVSLRISKLPLDVHEITALRSLGVTTVTDLAACDLTEIMPRYEQLVAHRYGVGQRLQTAAHRARMIQAGVELERTTSGPITVPGGGIEIDLDIESSADSRVYLWGFLVHDIAAGTPPVYHPIAAFEELTDESEAELALTAMRWLQDTIAGKDALVYHYSDYEVVRLGQIAKGSPSLAWTMDFARKHFVDLFKIVRRHFFGLNGLGLKNVAKASTDFHWRDPDPGGLNSQTWFEQAVHGETPEARMAARKRVLAYNEDDVTATWHLRAWLRRQ